MRLILCFLWKQSPHFILLSLYLQSQELYLILVGPFQLRISYDSSLLPCLRNLPQCDTTGSCEMYLGNTLRYLCALSSVHRQQTFALSPHWLVLPQNCLLLLCLGLEGPPKKCRWTTQVLKENMGNPDWAEVEMNRVIFTCSLCAPPVNWWSLKNNLSIVSPLLKMSAVNSLKSFMIS